MPFLIIVKRDQLLMKSLGLNLICLYSILLISFSLPAQNFSPKREFRGVWVATVKNIDWPSKAGLTTDEQQQELIALLDMHQKNGMNAIIMQVRPAADAFL